MAPKTGKIKLVKCINFVTYSNFTFNAKEYLNIILAPNGTGKSTIVSAIFLGLGGELKFIRPSATLSDYVRNGEDNAMVTVELYADDEGCTSCRFRRQFNLNNECEFYVNDKKMSRRAYVAEVAKFNVQINNLCQVLPQDRLHEFTNMNAQELFINTLLAVNGSQAQHDFDNLKNMRATQLTTEKRIEELNTAKERSKLHIESLREGMERYNAIKEYKKKVEICNIKIEWLKLQSLRKECENFHADEKYAQKNCQLRTSQYQSLEKQTQEIMKNVTKFENQLQLQKSNKGRAESTISEHKKTFFELEQKTAAAKHNFELQKRRLKAGNAEIEKSERMAVVHEDDYRRMQQAFDKENIENSEKIFQRDLRAHQNEILHQNQSRSSISSVLDTEILPAIKKLKENLGRYKNLKDIRMQFLNRRAPDVVNAVSWLRNNRDKFKKNVYEPVLLEVNFHDPNYIKYFENTVGLRDLLAFTCESKEDMATLTHELCEKQKLKINAVYSAPARECRYKPHQSMDNLRHLGFKDYLLDLIDAPPAILNSLCGMYHLHNIPVSDNNVTIEEEDLSGIGLYFAGNFRVNITTSRYTQKKSFMQVQIKPLNIFERIDQQEISTIEKSLTTLVHKADSMRNQRTTIEAQITRLSHEAEQLKKNITEIETQKEKIRSCKLLAQRKRQIVNRMREEETKITPNANDVAAEIQKYTKEMWNVLKLQYETIEKYNQAELLYELNDIWLLKCKHTTRNQEDLLEEAKTRAQEAKRLLNSVVDQIARKETEVAEQRSAILQLTGGIEPTNKNYGHHSIFRELPNDEEEIQIKINECISRAELLGEENDTLQQYEREERKITQLQKNLGEINADLILCLNKMDELFVPWFNNIEQIVNAVHEKFSNYAKTIGFSGAVKLECGEERDFDSYGLRIMVAFRTNAELQALSRIVQSGGERSLSIAVYTLSLQQMTCVPFRCVDEINQGMDSTNERKIFDLLLRETTRNESSQYFFVTPKLLPNLPHNERISCHIIFNGGFIDARGYFAQHS